MSIDHDALSSWVGSINPAEIRPFARPAELTFDGTPAEQVRWWLLVDCLNFCFWTVGEPWQIDHHGRTWGRYLAMVACLRRVVDHDRSWLEPRRWAQASVSDLQAVFAGRGCIPMLADRVRILNETGRVTLKRFDGEPLRILEGAEYNAVQVAETLADTYPSFHDVHPYRGRPVAILKRAQIFAADVALSFEQNRGPKIVDMDRITAFADYRIPQILRHLGILKLSPEVERRIEAGELIPASSPEEIEIRACSIDAVERMTQALQTQRAAVVPAWMLDEYLWFKSHDPDVKLQHHRTFTWFY